MQMAGVVLLALVILAFASAAAPTAAATQSPDLLNNTVNIQLINTYCTEEYFDSTRVLVPVERATEEEETEDFRLSVEGTSGTSTSEIDVLLNGLLLPPQKLAVFHPGCTNSTTTFADISNHFSSLLVTYAFSTLPTTPHDGHLQMLPAEAHLATGVASLVKFFGWQRIAVLSGPAPVFSSISGALSEQLKGNHSTGDNQAGGNINVTHTLILDDKLPAFPEDNRIILINTFPRKTREILCQAFKLRMHHPSYVWIIYEWNKREWWNIKQDETDECANNDIEQMLEGTLVVSHHPILALTNEESLEYGSDMDLTPNFTNYYEAYAYDAIRALTEFAARPSNGSASLVDLFDDISFHGVSGPVSFKSGLRQLENVTIKQYRSVNGELELVTVGQAHTDQSQGFTYSPGEDNNTIWEETGGIVPQDGTPKTVVNVPLLPLMVLLYIYATAGIIFAIACLIINIIFREKRLIRLTSPTLNYAIIFGAIVFYCSVYTFFYVPQTSSFLLVIVCNFRLWLTSLGFSLCYIPINAKMWRVYHICHKPNPSMKKTLVKDWHLMLIIAGFVAADLILLTVITAIDSARYSLLSIPDKEHSETKDDDGIRVLFVVTRCFSSTEVIWLSFVIGYKLVIQAIGVFLAFSIRNVKIKGLNDSKEISMILYITTVITFVVAVSTFLFGDYINVDAAVYGFGISTATTVVLALIFIPKMVMLYKDPNGEKIFSTVHGAQSETKSQANLERVIILERQVKELRGQLEEKKKLSLDTTTTSCTAEKDISSQSE